VQIGAIPAQIVTERLVFGVISAFLIVLFFGIYFAVDPETYVRLPARITPEAQRDEVRLMLHQTGDVPGAG
jgi:predicted PurR-regulated permease PerM